MWNRFFRKDGIPQRDAILFSAISLIYVDNYLSISYQQTKIALRSFVILGQKMEDKPLIIPIDQIKADFDKFLTPEHNRRIIFSGPFGIGKTYFLHEFFDDKKEYFPVFLRPINYSLLSNEDVFRFIKYDILCQLVENKKFDIEKSFDFTGFDYTKLFLGQNGFAILFNLLKYMPKIGTYVKASQKLGILVEKFQEGLKSFNENKELKLLKEFGEQTENHFLFENDDVTEFISQQLEKIVSPQTDGEQKKQKVLIIDDLDRLDPEHIFRLFNVFSAHFDQLHYYENLEGNDNKFGFDKIIFVCDIENIRKIFAHKYGADVDFSGYIDKFYSTEIFYLVHDNVFDIVLKYAKTHLKFIDNGNREIQLHDYFKFVLRFLFVSNQLNIREIIRLERFKPREQFVRRVRDTIVLNTKKGGRFNSLLCDYPILVTIEIFREIIGDDELLISKFKKGYLKYNNNDEFHSHFEFSKLLPELLLFSEMDNHNFDCTLNSQKELRSYELSKYGQIIKYKLAGDYNSTSMRSNNGWYRIDLEESQVQVSNGFFYNVLFEGITKVLKSGII